MSFNDLYEVIWYTGWRVSVIVGILFLIVGFVRLAKKYALAEDINPTDEFWDSSFFSRFVIQVLMWIGIATETDKKDFETYLGAHPGGTAFDCLLFTLFLLLFVGLWPVTIIGLVIGIPIHISHKYHAKRREFIERLNGTKKEIE